MATYDPYGLNDFSSLGGWQQGVAQTIQRAFANSAAQRDRQLGRYPALRETLQTSPALGASFYNDAALQQATTTASLLNQDQQLRDVIDASHRTPHGFSENLSAYLPLLGSAANLVPLLFGREAGAGLLNKGLVGTVAHWFTGPDGKQYPIGADGKVLGVTGNSTIGGQGPTNFSGNATLGNPMSAAWGDWNTRMQYGPPVDYGMENMQYGPPINYGLPDFGTDFGGFADLGNYG